MPAKTTISLFLALSLAACGEARPPAPTEAENRRLDEADAMLNEAGNGLGTAAPDPASTERRDPA